MTEKLKNLVGGLAAINCYYNHKPTRDEHRCYSTECMLNQHPDIARDIQAKGCRLFAGLIKDEKGIRWRSP